jgi:hypothetical protein
MAHATEAPTMNLELFSKDGRWTEPTPEALAAVSEAERTAIGNIRNAAAMLDTATVAVESNEHALADIRVEIKTLEKSVPKVTFNDLAKAQARDTQRRKMGL